MGGGCGVGGLGCVKALMLFSWDIDKQKFHMARCDLAAQCINSNFSKYITSGFSSEIACSELMWMKKLAKTWQEFLFGREIKVSYDCKNCTVMK